MARTKSKATPTQIAAESVRAFFADFMSSTDGPDADVIDNAIGAVMEALTAEHEKANGRIGDSDHGVRELLVTEVGYLVGVQVGLRLAGGVR